MLIAVTQALGEMAIVFPVSGGFYTLASRMLDPSFAFAMGWNYVLQWAVVLPLEIVSIRVKCHTKLDCVADAFRSSLVQRFNIGTHLCRSESG